MSNLVRLHVCIPDPSGSVRMRGPRLDCLYLILLLVVIFTALLGKYMDSAQPTVPPRQLHLRPVLSVGVLRVFVRYVHITSDHHFHAAGRTNSGNDGSNWFQWTFFTAPLPIP